LSNKSTFLLYKISYRIIIKILQLSYPLLWKTPNDICIVKEFWSKSRFRWEMRMEAGTFWIFCGFDVHFASFAVKILLFWGMFEHFTSVASEFLPMFTNSSMFFKHDLINWRFAKKTLSSIFVNWLFLDRTGKFT
jgi:hypothetical protein